jgi:hypothetical protein
VAALAARGLAPAAIVVCESAEPAVDASATAGVLDRFVAPTPVVTVARGGPISPRVVELAFPDLRD